MSIQDKLKQSKEIIVGRLNSGESMSKIAKDFNCNSGTLWYYLKSIGISGKQRSKSYGECENNKLEIINKVNAGMSVYKIAKEFGIGKSSVLKKLHSWGVDCSAKRTGNPNNLLKDKKDLVLELHNQDKSQSEIAKIVGHGQVSICRLLEDNDAIKRDWKYSVDDTFFEKIDNEDKAYILGWWYSDGNVMPSGKCRIQIGEKDKHILEYIKRTMKYESELIFVPKRQPQHQNMWCINIDRIKIKEDLVRLGCYPNKSLTLQFPSLEQVPSNLVHHFVRGYFDGDGSSANGIMITGSYSFIYSLKNILPCNITNIYQRYKNRPIELSAHQLFIGRSKEIQKFNNWIYSNASIFLERKRA